MLAPFLQEVVAAPRAAARSSVRDSRDLSRRSRPTARPSTSSHPADSRDEILSLIDTKARRAGRDLGFVRRHYATGALDDFGKLAEAYALCDLLDRDDPAFLAV